MSTYDLEEQEQLATLKAWWQQYGGLVVTAVTAVAIAFAAWNGWQWYQRSQSVQASQVFAELQKAAAANDLKKTRDLAGTLLESYPRTTYAALGALVSAKAHFEANDLKTARVQLEWVVEHARSAEMVAVTRLRLASVLLDEKTYDEALKVLDAKRDPAFDARFAELRGDVLSAKGAVAEARAAYSLALEKTPANDSGARELLQLKLDGLGGA
jgi:predicted negative regulator of RcsB-dependent stress response